ncbi:MAG: hypothetical protein P8126_00990 [Gammaproteobacteria bacterium]|jgi:anti-anti-sigma regulatory factor
MKVTTNVGSVGSPEHAFLSSEGDTLEMPLPREAEGYLYDQLHREINSLETGAVKNIVFDCASVENLSADAMASLIRLERFAGQSGIRLVMMDAPVTVFDALAPLLHDAVWANSYRQACAHVAPSPLTH